MKNLILALAALASLAACDGGAADDQVIATEAPEAIRAEATASDTLAPTATASVPVKTIPSAIRGRWGLVPGDCTSTRGDAKGLLTIDGTTLKFYESVGTLDEIEEAGDTRIRAEFDFTGEGMEWERDEVLDVQDNGQTLIRREYGDGAAPGAFRYSKCA